MGQAKNDVKKGQANHEHTKTQKTQNLPWEITHKWEISAYTSSWRSTVISPSFCTWLSPKPDPALQKDLPNNLELLPFWRFSK